MGIFYWLLVIQYFIFSENYPDPANNYTIIPYKLPTGINGRMQITDIKGRLIADFEIYSEQEQINFDTKQLEPGVYTYSVIIKGMPVITKKMIIKH